MKMLPVILLSCVMSLCMTTKAGATELRLHIQGPDQRKVSVEKAEIILIGWGWIERIALTPDIDTVRLNFESLVAKAPEKFRNIESAQLYVRAPNLAAVQSELFEWPGTVRDGTATVTTIDFRGGRSAAIPVGSDQEMTVTMRRTQTRQVRLLDDAGKPIAGLKLSAYRFETGSNHCGILMGEELKVGSTDANGRMTVPDGDFKYAFKLNYGPHYSFTSPKPSASVESFVTVLLTQPETVLRLHRFEAVRLALRVFVGNVPSTGISLTDSRNLGSCGAATGILGKTGSDGRLLVEKYYPEERDGICIVDDKGKLLWGKESEELSRISRNPIEVRLPAGTTFGQTDFPCPFP